jgi:hypothetical protein
MAHVAGGWEEALLGMGDDDDATLVLDTTEPSVLVKEPGGLAALKDIIAQCTSAVAGLDVVVTGESHHYLHATKDIEVPKGTVLGSLGPGNYVPHNTDITDMLLYEFPDGDRTLTMLEDDDKAADSTVKPLYQVIRSIERTGILATKINISYMKPGIMRTIESDGKVERFSFEPKQAMMFKWDPLIITSPAGTSEAKKAKKGGHVTSKNVFALRTTHATLSSSALIKPVFKFRFDKIGGNLKPRKPYIITSASLVLSAGDVLKAPCIDVIRSSDVD